MTRLSKYAWMTAEVGFDEDAAFFAAYPFDVDDRAAVVGGMDVSHVGLAEFLYP